MAVTIVRAGVAMPNAFGIIIPDNKYAPRYKCGDLVLASEMPADVGDEVICETTDGGIAIGDLVQCSGDFIVLADCCHVKKNPDVTISAARYWQILGCQFNYEKRSYEDRSSWKLGDQSHKTGEVAA